MDTKVISTGIRYSSLPESYVRPESERPKLSEVEDCQNVPIIDLGCEDRSLIVHQIGQACQFYGFFQVINHGVSMEVVEKMLQVSNEFFNLSVEEKMKLYSDDPSKTMRLSTSFNVKKEKVHNWRDYLRLHCYPLDQYVPEWPSNPPSFKLIVLDEFYTLNGSDFQNGTRGGPPQAQQHRPVRWQTGEKLGPSVFVRRDIVSNYCSQVRDLGFRLQEAIAESLGLDKEHIKKVLGEQGQHMAVNYYPPCPEPELTYGLPGHTDPNALTILLQDLEVAGLQVLMDGKWMAVKPYPNAFVINLGDQLQALSNSRYRSVWHRAIVNADKPRMSIASFLCPCDDALISPPNELTEDGTGAVYRNFTYAEYYKKFWSRNLDEEHCLELFKN